MPFSVIIPSKNARNLIPCVQAIAKCEPQLAPERIIVVDDGLVLTDEQKVQSGVRSVPGVKPFVFTRNCNVGIRAARTHDVILLNDDALLESPGGLTALARQSAEHPEYGIIASTCNFVGNPNQNRCRGRTELRDEPRMVCFICVYIPRRTIDAVGLLDERYIGYGMDDDDYCWSVRKAGLKIGIHDGCYVNHGALVSTYRRAPSLGTDMSVNSRLFQEKWGFDNWGRMSTMKRPEAAVGALSLMIVAYLSAHIGIICYWITTLPA